MDILVDHRAGASPIEDIVGFFLAMLRDWKSLNGGVCMLLNDSQRKQPQYENCDLIAITQGRAKPIISGEMFPDLSWSLQIARRGYHSPNFLQCGNCIR